MHPDSYLTLALQNLLTTAFNVLTLLTWHREGYAAHKNTAKQRFLADV